MASKQGFTLIEIVVVLLILGIFAAAAIPNFISFIEQTKAQLYLPQSKNTMKITAIIAWLDAAIP